MPHITVKHFPRDLNEEQKKALADDLCEMVKKHFGSKDGSLSVALIPVEQERWKEEVYDVEIGPELETLARKPGYSL
ncbi:tautomerase PptA [Enterobacteriaceae bacterium H11S18]|uniref:tautomerase PptA n=1 Tax=Dryocola clanedunensis TaxID=2925396 RepID=UPI0022F047DC|nr:tautomerase PptA [Dryocola clanedunensis]MCT4706373.1 tautomerase PptA [Dryocola clanedunensis]MCT4713126.1 tautomerase PptA [Dryocola clanedunensis]